MTLCDTNGSSLPHQVAEATTGESVEALEGVDGRHPLPQRPGVRGRELARRGRGRAPPRPGHDQRHRRAHRQRQPDLDPPGAPAEARLRVRERRAARPPDRDRALRGRAAERDAAPRAAVRGPQRLRPQGRDARRRRQGRRPHLRAHGPRARRATSASWWSPSCPGKGTVHGRAERGRASSSTTSRPRGRCDPEGARAPRLPVRGRATPPSSCCCGARPARYEPLFKLESFRVITEKREDGKVQTEATIKVWVEGERYVKTAEGNGPVNALDARAARCDHRPPPAPGRHRADQLQGPHPRRAPRHRRGHPGPAGFLRRRARVGLDRRLGEHHRGLLGGAGGLARVRVPAPSRPRRPTGGRADTARTT